MSYSEGELAICLRVLQVVADDPAQIQEHKRFKALVAKTHREGKRGERRSMREARQASDLERLAATQIVRQQLAQSPALPLEQPTASYSELLQARRCYIYKQSFTHLHHFYHQLCPQCAGFNYAKRTQRADLRGRVALVTEGRIKIGYQMVLRLLRDGARIIMTTRFPLDAASRFALEADFAEWQDRLQIVALDLRHLPYLEQFCDQLCEQLDSVDMVINNAAQTVKCPRAFYQHLLEQRIEDFLQAARQLLPNDLVSSHDLLETPHSRGDLAQLEPYFPLNSFDSDGQQLDLRANQQPESQTSFPRGTLMLDGWLDLCKQQLGPLGCRMVTEALAQNATIQSILLGTDAIGDQGAHDVAELIKQNPNLRIVYLGCNQIGAQASSALAQALVNNQQIEGLWLKRNPIGPEGALALAEMLRHNQHLRMLDLVNTQLGDDGLSAILGALIEANQSLERLYLGGNQIGPKHATLLAKLIRVHPRLSALFLNVNRLGDQGAVMIAQAIAERDQLRELGLSSNGIGDRGAVALAEALTGNQSLILLELGYSPSTRVLAEKGNQIGDQGAAALAVMLVENRSLVRLNLARNLISEAGHQSFIKALQSNTYLQELILDGKQNILIQSLLQRNCALATQPYSVPHDVVLIRSVYRTKVY